MFCTIGLGGNKKQNTDDTVHNNNMFQSKRIL